MPGLWKAWKAKGRLPTLSTSPLEISPKAGEIPTFPQLRRRGRMENQKQVSHFPTAPSRYLKKPKNHGGEAIAPPAVAAALRAAAPKTSTSSVTFLSEATRAESVV